MTVATFPSGQVKRITARYLHHDSTAVASPFTSEEQVQDWGGRRWVYEFEVAPQRGRAARKLAAMLNRVGTTHPFVFRDPTMLPEMELPQLVVDGDGQWGRLLQVRGIARQGVVMFEGDFVSIGTGLATRLYQVDDDVVAAGGRATIRVTPTLRIPPANGAPIEVAAPAVLLRLTQPAPPNIDRPDRFTFSLSTREVI